MLHTSFSGCHSFLFCFFARRGDVIYNTIQRAQKVLSFFHKKLISLRFFFCMSRLSRKNNSTTPHFSMLQPSGILIRSKECKIEHPEAWFGTLILIPRPIYKGVSIFPWRTTSAVSSGRWSYKRGVQPECAMCIINWSNYLYPRKTLLLVWKRIYWNATTISFILNRITIFQALDRWDILMKRI